MSDLIDIIMAVTEYALDWLRFNTDFIIINKNYYVALHKYITTVAAVTDIVIAAVTTAFAWCESECEWWWW